MLIGHWSSNTPASHAVQNVSMVSNHEILKFKQKNVLIKKCNNYSVPAHSGPAGDVDSSGGI